MFPLALRTRPLAACVATASVFGVVTGRADALSFGGTAKMSSEARTATGAAVIVGVSYKPGLGFAVAKRFAAGGMKVGIIGRQKDKLEACKAGILAEVPSAQVECVVADATVKEDVQGAFANLRKILCQFVVVDLMSRCVRCSPPRSPHRRTTPSWRQPMRLYPPA